MHPAFYPVPRLRAASLAAWVAISAARVRATRSRASQPSAVWQNGVADGQGFSPGRQDTPLHRSRRRADPRLWRYRGEIGGGSCRERVCQVGKISVVAVSLTKTKTK